MTGLIALHAFHDAPTGRTCQKCGMLWVTLLSCRAEHVGEMGWACHGALLEREYAEIEAERERVWACL